MDRLVSVIVPVYNCGKYIADCLDSICNQSYSNIEILIVNDGSTDNSKEICLSYLEIDPRVRYFEQNNSGVSSARNLATKYIVGEYVLFIDGDDLIDINYVETLMRELIKTNSDITMCDVNKFSGVVPKRSDNTTNYEVTMFDKSSAIDNILYEQTIIGGPFAKLFNKRCIDGILFDNKIHYAEDLKYNIEVLNQTHKNVHLNYQGYYYRYHKEGATKKSYVPNRMTAFNAMIDISLIVGPSHRKAISSRTFMESIYIITNILTSDVSVKTSMINVCWQNICRNRFNVLCDSKSPNTAKRYALISYLGIRVMSRIIIKRAKVINNE